MDARFYNSDDVDIDRLADDLINAYLAQGFKAQRVGGRDQVMVQLKKGGDFEAIIGMQAALSVTLQRTTGGVLAIIGQQRWIDKAAVGAVGIAVLPVLWPLALTAGVGAIRQASLANQVLNMVDGLVRQQRPGLSGGPVPSYLLPQIQQQLGAPPSAEPPMYVPPPQLAGPPPQAALPPPGMGGGRRCAHCNTPHEAGDTFCSGCGRPLTAPKLYCPNCHSELKPGISFCPKCGASTYSTVSATHQSIPPAGPAPSSVSAPSVTYVPSEPPATVYQPPQPPAPVYQPPKPEVPVYTPPPQPPAPVYQPPKPEVPVYTPPPQPPKPPTPVYTPPPQPKDPVNPPQPQVYYTPSQPASNPAPAKKEEEQYYIPTPTQEPTVKPQSKVTIVPARQEPPPPKAKPQKQYYIPSNQSQPAEAQPASQPVAPQPIAKPVASSGPWGTLTFSDGQQMTLSGESAVVGRYDNDLGGIKPEVDLGRVTGSDTVSRSHAVFEYSGSSYTLTDLNSTNATKINGKRLEPDKATSINDGDTIQFGKITCTFKKS